jgi:hypothetical protein
MDKLPIPRDVIDVLAEASHMQDANNNGMGLKRWALGRGGPGQ